MNNIQLVDRLKCVGCTACAEICPQQSITMNVDFEGFSYPKVDENTCIECEMCLKHCPVYVHDTIDRPKASEGFAAIYKDTELYLKSSSGGMFACFARYVIEMCNGYVCGACMANGTVVKHIIIHDMAELDKIQGSKYVQSDLHSILAQIKYLLESRKIVLFSGTPCQAAGLRAYLGRDYDNLFIVDIICHGVPSPAFFQRHIRAKYGNDIGEVKFRTKTRFKVSGYDLIVTNKSGKIVANVSSLRDEYYNLFLNGKSYRESCYHCLFANAERVGDITIGDCGSVMQYADKLPVMKAVSSVLINNKKGWILWNGICDEVWSCDLNVEAEIKANKQLHTPVLRTAERDSLYSVLMQNPYSYRAARQFMIKETLRDRIRDLWINYIPAKTRMKIMSIIKRKA